MTRRPPRLGTTQVDLLIAFAGGALSALEALEAMASWTEPPPVSTFYRHLTQAVDAGWVAVEDDVVEPVAPGRSSSGRPPRRYQLTEAGEHEAHAAARRSARMLEHFRAATSTLGPTS